MQTRCHTGRSILFGALVVLMSLGERQVHAQATVQSGPPGSSERSASRPSPPAVRKLFKEQCAKCHGSDGTGTPARGLMSGIPDFTNPSWQRQRSDAQLLGTIFDGHGTDMPAFRGKITEDQARGLMTHVRTFAPTVGKGARGQHAPETPSNFEKEFSGLQAEMDKLKKQAREVREAPTARKSPNSLARADLTEPAESKAHATSQPRAYASSETTVGRALFQQHCVKCHGADGAGTPARHRQPEIPDFTDSAWQAQRTDAQLLASIQNGKGKEMPAWRGKISEEQARGLLGHVRAFGSDSEGSRQEEGERPPSDSEKTERSSAVQGREAEQPADFFGKLVGWLGRFHPAIVHFPIGLLTAAAVAESLRLATGKPIFEEASRFCIWFGALAALPAAALGWFAGGFCLSDASWVLMTHRWLGTFTVVCALLLLVLSEVCRRRDRPRARIWCLATLLVVAVLVLITGFLGGAIAYGLDHYSWPDGAP
jgi:mono/diheme cytochrome c family protein/uncharacterized membrane protein